MNSGKIVAGGWTDGTGDIEGSTRGPRGPKKSFLGLPNTQPHSASSLDQKWSGYSDKLIVRASVLLSIAITIGNVVVEIIWKLNFGQNLIATSHTYIYMGMQVGCILRYVFNSTSYGESLNTAKYY